MFFLCAFDGTGHTGVNKFPLNFSLLEFKLDFNELARAQRIIHTHERSVCSTLFFFSLTIIMEKFP